MAPSNSIYPLHGLLKVATAAMFTVAFFFLLITVLTPKSGGSSLLVVSDDENMDEIAEKMVKIGSKPPECVNKCRNCRPCMATLVVPKHQKMGSKATSSHREDDSYYLLSWKCKCGNKLFQP